MGKAAFDIDPKKYDDILGEIRRRINAGEETEYLPIKNDTFEHAKILFRHMAEMAEYKIYIFTSTLCRDFYLNQPILDALAQKDKIEMKIIVSNANAKNIKSVCDAIIQRNEKISIEVKGAEVKSDNGDRVNDFTVVDNTIYRYETKEDTEPKCKAGEHIEAIASFNDEESANFLKELFLKTYKKSNKIIYPIENN